MILFIIGIYLMACKHAHFWCGLFCIIEGLATMDPRACY